MRVLEYAMTSEQIEQLFEINGYSKVPSNLPEFTFYFRRESQGAVVIHVIDYRQGVYISEDQYTHLKQKITEFMYAKGEPEVHLLSLILSNDTEKARQLCARDSFCWTIDTEADRLVIYENQADDFYGWKGILEEFLRHPDFAGAKGETYGNGSIHTGYKPEEGEGRIRKPAEALPWVNICLVIANVIVFLICTFTGDLLYNKGALGVMLVIEDQSCYRMFTSMFLHADAGHLFSNMIILYYLGQTVERRLGHIPYAALYFLSGLAGGVLSMGYELLTGVYTSSVGASGAVFGVEGALLLLAVLHRGRGESVPVGRVAFAVAFSLYCGFTSTDVNNAAHVGGILMGFAAAAVFCILRPNMGTEKRRK